MYKDKVYTDNVFVVCMYVCMYVCIKPSHSKSATGTM